jgi:uncharacterized membrane protein YdjX (TVP38/TMEM64 family)
VPAVTARRALLLGLVGLFVAGTAWAYATGRVSAGAIEGWIASLGPLGPAIFAGAFVGGAMIGLPGMMFVIGGRLAFGAETGFPLVYGAGVLACVVPFAAARRLRGDGAARWRPKQRHLQRAFDLIESHPLRAVVLLRLGLWFNPPLSYALAMTEVPARVYVAGCIIGLLPVVTVAVLAIGWLA